MEYSNTVYGIYNNIDNNNLNRTCKKLIVFDDMIVDMNTNKKISIYKLGTIYLRQKTFFICIYIYIYIYIAFIRRFDFLIPKDVILNSMRYLIMKINNNRKSKKIATDHSADIDYKDFMKIYRKCTRKSYFYLTILSI